MNTLSFTAKTDAAETPAKVPTVFQLGGIFIFGEYAHPTSPAPGQTSWQAEGGNFKTNYTTR